MAKRLNTDLVNGLTTSVATERFKEFGPNQLTEKKVEPWYFKLFKELTTPFALMLWTATVLSFIA